MDEAPSKRHTDSPSCPWRAALGALGGKWKGLILWRLESGAMRFGELRRAVEGVTEKILAEQLRELESDGLIARQDYRESPPRVEYSLTQYGSDALPVVYELTRWGRRHLDRQ